MKTVALSINRQINILVRERLYYVRNARFLSAVLSISLLSSCTESFVSRDISSWAFSGQSAVETDANHRLNRKHAKNVILFIGDGMGPSTVTAIRILDGQLKGGKGEENILSWESFPYVALSKTYNTNQQVPDSAGTATAILTGVKTKAGMISVGPKNLRGQCSSVAKNRLSTVLELAEEKGLSTGIVTTARLTHATPAAAYAHSPERDWEADVDIPEKEKACLDIAAQFVSFAKGGGIDVAFGGGRQNFLPSDQNDPEYESQQGRRGDGRNLISEWLANNPSGAFIWNRDQLLSMSSEKRIKLLGLFEPSNMQFELDRNKGVEPSLMEMTKIAIEVLSNNNKGYFLLVEGGRIDHGHHKGQAAYALHDGVAFANAVQIADDLTSDDDTLIVVTADHSHVFTIAGYPTRGNPILGKVIGNDFSGNPEKIFKLADDGKPYTTLGYLTGPGANFPSQFRPDITKVDTTAKNYQQHALIPLKSETHGGEDVAIYAKGPGAEKIHGVMEQNLIFQTISQFSGTDQ